MNTIENNILIAEFMGFGIIQSNIYNIPVTDSIIGIGYVPEKMEYNSSWDWLMPVVEKIESLDLEIDHNYCYSVGNFEDGISSGRRKIDMIVRSVYLLIDRDEVRLTLSDNGCTTDELYNRGSKFENLYNAVIHFINWYNENK